jgi:hypothetical protein
MSALRGTLLVLMARGRGYQKLNKIRGNALSSCCTSTLIAYRGKLGMIGVKLKV